MTKLITISDQLFLELEGVLKKKGGAADIHAYVEELLQKALLAETDGIYKPHDEAEIRDRLKSLGYID
ncbi:MAG: hypothetical protein HYV32_00445 [Candidatus Kerfeldbacteria bacterium]|nr:hypothetical protein [Candidatus Kerfeldbacteria bacterium]